LGLLYEAWVWFLFLPTPIFDFLDLFSEATLSEILSLSSTKLDAAESLLSLAFDAAFSGTVSEEFSVLLSF